MNDLLSVILLVIATAATANDSQAQTLEWVDNHGGIHYTDSEKKVPEGFRDRVQISDLGGIEDYAKKSAVSFEDERGYEERMSARLQHLREVNAVAVINPNLLNDCSGFVSTRKIRVQEGDYNRSKIVVIDECGRVVSVTGQYPEIQINR